MAEAKLNVKLQVLNLTSGKTKEIVESANIEKIKRHRDALINLIKAVEDLKIEVVESKLTNEVSVDEVEKWQKDIEAKIDQVDVNVDMLQNCIKETDKHAENERISKEQELLARKREETLKFEKEQFEQRAKMEKEHKESQAKSTKDEKSDKPSVKLPKLVITPFDGKLENWLGFWNKYEAEIDSANLSSVSKFAYLKELMEPNVRKQIDGLPFTTEGYERAKNILKATYGKTSEIINAYIENISALPTISGSQPAKIHTFYQTLSLNVQSLETLGKTTECWSMVRGVLDKLPGIKADLVRGKSDWQSWGFSQLLVAIKEWTEIHPNTPKAVEKPSHVTTRQRSFQAQEQTVSTRECVYCGEQSHKSLECTTIKSTSERKKILKDKSLCFNCTGSKHRADKCKSRGTCANCKKRHHTSICDKTDGTVSSEKHVAMTATDVEDKVCHPVVIVKVNGVKCRALLDTGSTNSYVSSFLVNLLNVKSAGTVRRTVKTIVGLVTRRVQTYNVEISDTSGKCVLPTCVDKVNCEELLSLDNPNYPEILKKYSYLRGVHMEETATKDKLPVHVVLGVNEYTKIKMAGYQRAGNMGEPVAEKTRFGWTIMTTGAEVDIQTMLLTQTAASDYEELCRLDVLGLQDTPSGDQQAVYAEFKEQLHRNPEGWYETGLPWKGDHSPLLNNKEGSLKRLETLVNKLRRNDQLEAYDTIIQEQLKDGIIEEAEEPANGREFYIPHKAVIREDSETTKMRIVYDASARPTANAPSLNECLDIGPPLQNQLWKVLVRGRFHAVAVAGDIKKAFLQVRIRADDRDALRFHWINIKDPNDVRTYRFTRALFGLGPSPFLLGGVIEQHLNSQPEELMESVNEIKRGLYVDDLILGGESAEKALEKKTQATDIFKEANFQLHKWHSNAKELEVNQDLKESEISYAKDKLGTKSEQCKLLGLTWDKNSDTLSVSFPQKPVAPTKREVLSKVAKVFDPLGLVTPLLLQGKLIYRDACLEKCAWDAELPKELVKRWDKWQNNLPQTVCVPRALVNKDEPVERIHLHGFGDASGKRVATAVSAVVEQKSGINQGLVAARARLAKQGLTIPRLELIAGHMTVNLLANVCDALTGFPVSSMTGWLDSSVALHWISGGGEYKQFVRNRVNKINEHADVKWRHVPTQDNPADLGSRGGPVPDESSWWTGPEWLSDSQRWPPMIVSSPTPESEVEAKPHKQIMAVAVQQKDEMDTLLSKSTLWRTLRVCAWIRRFIYNSKQKPNQRIKGPLSTDEIERQKTFWVRRIQRQHAGLDKFKEDELRLNLKPNAEGVLVCCGRIQGEYPVYLPDTSLYAEKIVEEAHRLTLHGGVGLTMAKVRETFWIPRLRRMVKRVVKRCAGCKRFQAVAFANPPVGPLPDDRTKGTTPFEVIGVDYMGPMTYKVSTKKEGKAYILLYSCSLTRAVHLELMQTLETQDFLKSFKAFIARRGRPKKIYSDNGSTFIGAAGWLRKVMHDERFNDFLAQHSIVWSFNLSRAPWWGGQFERMVGLVKRSLQKSAGRALLSWDELSELLLDIEVALNGRPLSYVEDDHELPTLTPNALLYPQSNTIPILEAHHMEDFDLRKRAKYLESCKKTMWTRWTSEYVRGLRERHNLKHNKKRLKLAKGDVVIIRGDEKDRNYWKLGIVQDLIVGRDGETRAAKLRAGKRVLERAVQQLYPLELSCDHEVTIPRQQLSTARV